ncbi:MAG TPA: PAS domain S-box protein [Dissulfurispiraceae bacterium]|nr:PAS domain S-box protein [Dissulfurispiraceae bacterium]
MTQKAVPDKSGIGDCRAKYFGVIKVVLLYAVFAAFWIFFSDKAVGMLFATPSEMTKVSIIKGWVFVALTSVLLYALIRRLITDLRHSEERFRLMFEQAAVGVAEINSLTGQFLRVNQRYCDIVGYSREEMLRMDFQSITHLDDLAVYLAHMEQLKAGTISQFTMEKQYYRKDNTVVWVTLTVSQLWSPGDSPTKHVAVIQDITERKRAEKALEASEEQYKLLFSANPNPMFVFDEETLQFLAVNDAAVAKYGWSREEFLSMTVLDIRPLEDKHLAYSTIQQTMNARETDIGVFPHNRKDGNVIHMDIRVSSIHFMGRHGRLCSMTDVTERRRAEVELQNANSHSRHLNSLLRSLYLVQSLFSDARDVQKLLVAVCETLVETRGYVAVWFGKPQKEPKLVIQLANAGSAKNLMQHAPIMWDDSPLGCGPSGLAVREKRPIVFDDLANDPRFAPWRDPIVGSGAASIASIPLIREGEVQGVLTVKADRISAFDLEEIDLLTTLVTNLGNTLDGLEKSVALRRGEQNYREIFNATSDAIFVHDAESGQVLDVNSAMLQMYGCTYEEALQHEAYLFLKSPYSADDALRKIRAAVSEGPQAFEWQAARRSGELFWVEVTLKSVNIGGHTRVLAVVHDITERRKAESERVSLETQLQQSQKMEAVGQLAGGIAHDFNNILSAITGYGFLAQSQLDADNPVQKDIAQILESANRAAEVTHSLLAFSRKQLIKPMPKDINELIRKSVKILSRLIGEDIEIVLDLSNEALVCMVDVAQIDQVLMNIATNARDAMPNGGRFTLCTSKLISDKTLIEHTHIKRQPYAIVSISDTGAGMDQMTSSKIFEPFYTTKSIGKGTGLGLAMVYGIINQLDGHIEVKSELGKGTTFQIYLPLMAMGEEIEEQEQSGAPAGSGETILVAEDDETLRKLYNAILEKNGYNVILASDGDEAIIQFANNKDKVKLMLLDMIMPKRSGRQTYEAIKEMGTEAKFLFVTGYTADRVDKEILQNKGVNFITKPIAPSDLFRQIRKILDSA